MNLSNCTRVTEFIFIGLPRFWGMESMMYTGIFLLYLLCLMGNGLIVVMVIVDRHLQKPMYIFLSNLSCIDIGQTTTIIPKLLVNYLSAKNSICFNCCIAQLYFYFFFGVTEYFIISFISLDRYVAICHPLRYATIMTSRVCLKLAMAAWFGSFFSILYQEIVVANLPFCTSNIINHFYCDAGPLLKIAGGDIRVIKALGFLIMVMVVMSSLIFTIVSYLFIICTILRMPSTTRQQRAFSTCALHLVVVFMLYGPVCFIYLKSIFKNSSFSRMKIVSVVNTTVVPMLNPFIYTIRNNEVKEAVWKVLRKKPLAFPKV